MRERDRRVLAFPGTLALALALFGLAAPIRREPALAWTFLGAAGVLLAWAAALHAGARRTGRTLSMAVALRRPHYVQMCAQGAVLLYWGWHVRSVYAFAPFILAQVVFAYGVESLLCWTRRDRYALGAGPFPVVFSINLFLWFKPEWFHWQLAMVAAVYLGKELIRWTRDGRSVHVFNPSSFALAVASLALIVTGTSDRTLGLEIAATQYNPPHIFAVIFLASLPGQILFGVATMTVAAVVTVYGFSAAYFSLTGTYFFYDAYIPIAVFLGMHLLFTDPATSPRGEAGRFLFGVLYGLGVLASVVVLDAVGAPTFYDKLLPVPFLNLMVRRIDRVATSWTFPVLRPLATLTAAGRRLAVVGVWVLAFVSLRATGGVGDHHPGQYLPFWERTCRDGSARACDYLAVMRENYCDRGSGWACNELGIQLAERGRKRLAATAGFRRACGLDFAPGCENERRVRAGPGALVRGEPPLDELRIVLRGSKGPVRERTAKELYALACDRGWPGTCERSPDADGSGLP